jgi:hypothetical protein
MMPNNKNRGSSKEFRKQVVTITAQRLAGEIFHADGFNKPLCEARWDEYRTCLNDTERPIAVEAFTARMQKLGEERNG